MATTITFDEKVKGWTSFHSFIPDWMARLNNRYFTIKGGQLYIHNDPTAPRNNFYGASFPSKVSIMVNESPSDVKVWKSVSQEGTRPWRMEIKSFTVDEDEFYESNITEEEFDKKEGMWYAYVRASNNVPDVSSRAYYGIGVVDSVAGSTITIMGHNSSMSAGDIIFDENENEIGEIVLVDGSSIELTISSVPSIGAYIFGTKDIRTEGADLRGYVTRIDLEIDSTEKRELYAVNSEVFKSFK